RSNRARVVRLWTVAAVVLVSAGYALRAVGGHSSSGAHAPAVSTASAKTGVTRKSPTRLTSPETTTGPVAPPGQAVPILIYPVIESPPASAPYADLYLPVSLF